MEIKPHNICLRLLIVTAFAYVVSCSDEVIDEHIKDIDKSEPLGGIIIGSSSNENRAWTGWDLQKQFVITKVGFAPCVNYEKQVELGLFEAANDSTFFDAVPIAMIKENANSNEMHYLDVKCSRRFRYVRYVGPAGLQSKIARIEFYGYEGGGGISEYYQVTNLPTVVINTENSADIDSKTEEVKSHIYIISDSGRSILSSSAGVRGRGNKSWEFPKKPYRIKFTEKQAVLDSPTKAKKWTLINNYGDKTLMRNILAFEVSRRVGMHYTPFCVPVDLIVNGEYQGCYQLCDQVEVGPGRVDAKNGFLIEIDGYSDREKVNFMSKMNIPVTVKYPDDDAITSEQLSFITDYFNKMESAVFSESFSDEVTGYRKYLDIESFLRNFIIGEFCGNTDTFWSLNMYKNDKDGVLFTGPVWDYDLAFENDYRTYPINELNGYIYATSGSVAGGALRDLVTRIINEDETAHARLVELWKEVKPSLLSLCDYVDETAEILEESQKLNFRRWPILNEMVHGNFQATGSYEAEVKTIKDYIRNRLKRMDELLEKKSVTILNGN